MSATETPVFEGREATFRVGDMDCPSCVAKIERHLNTVDGVLAVRASVVARTLRVWHRDEVTTDRLQEEVGRLGYLAQPLEDGGSAAPEVWTGPKAKITYAAVALFTVGGALRLAGADTASDALLVAAALVGGLNFFGKGVRAAARLALDMNFLMTIAIVGALALGETLEAAAIAFLFSLAELLETFAVDRARSSLGALVALAPDSARLLRGDEEVVVPADVLVPGDVVVIRPGERIPVDGRIRSGSSAVDQSPITGESIPVDLTAGDPAFAGSVNGEGVLRLEVERPASESTLARIARLIEDAEANKAQSERFVERFARWYTPVVTGAAVLIAFGPPLLVGAPFEMWLLRGLTLLVIACPCALVISTPVAVVSGITAAARHGVLVKGGVHLEAMGSVRAVAFDKTGTLTVGHPRVVSIIPAGGANEDEVLRLAAAVEAGSAHPIARAIVDAARERGLRRDGVESTDARALPSAGAAARVDGVDTLVGKPEALAEWGVDAPPPAEPGRAGHTLVGVATRGALVGWIAVADALRDEAAAAVAELRTLGIRRVVMLTGDRAETAESVGAVAGVDEVRAGLMPEDKVAAIRELTATWGGVAMVGDGVNDGPALAASTVGIAMGAAGSDVALETADVALMGDELQRLPYVMRLSQRASRVIRQNVAIAILVKAVLAVGVPLGMVSLVAAVLLGDMGVSLVVIVNALRLGRVAA
jgi:Cd2+/Zn2+-exporting ATPase